MNDYNFYYDFEKKAKMLRGSNKDEFDKLFSSEWYKKIKSRDFILSYFVLLGVVLTIGIVFSILNNIYVILATVFLTAGLNVKIELNRNEISQIAWEQFLLKRAYLKEIHHVSLEQKIEDYLTKV